MSDPVRGPLRLRDDAALLEELGLDFAGEASSLPRFDLAELQAKLSSAVTAGGLPTHDPFDVGGGLHEAAQASGGAGGIATGGVGSAAAGAIKIGIVPVLIAVGLAAGGGAGTVALLEARPSPEPTVVATNPGREIPAAPGEPQGERPETARTDAPVEPPTFELQEPELQEPEPQEPKAAEPAAKRSPTKRAEPRSPQKPRLAQTPGGPSALERELALYRAAEEHFRAKRHIKAIEGFRGYIKTHPQGRLIREARLGLILAHAQAEHPRKVVRLGLPLLRDPAFRSRQEELHRLLQSALRQLGECPSLRYALKRRDIEQIEALAGNCKP